MPSFDLMLYLDKKKILEELLNVFIATLDEERFT